MNIEQDFSLEALISYLHNAHAYFIDFRLPHLREKLVGAIEGCPEDVRIVIIKFFDEYFINARYLENSYGNLWGRFKWCRQKRYVKQAYSIVRNGKCKV